MRKLLPFVMVAFVTGCATARPVAAPRAPVVEAHPPVAVAPVPSPEEKEAWSEAAVYTNSGKNWLVAAAAASDRQSQEMLLGSARATYLCAVRAWTDALAVTTVRTYATKFWLADAWNKVVRIEYILRAVDGARYAAPAATEVESAIAAATAVRDATESDEYVDAAAQFVIEEADVLRDLDELVYEETKGASGVARRTAVELEGPPDEQHVTVVPVPPSVERSVAARVAYVRRVPPARDPVDDAGVRSAVRYAFDAADVYFVYGQFAAAKELFDPVYRQECGRSEYGFRAWEKLISMAAKSNDTGEARRLAEAEQTRSCALTADQRAVWETFIVHDDFFDSDAAFVKACGRDLLSEKDRCDAITPALSLRWRTASSLYVADFERAPTSRRAPTSALRGAFAYKQAGDPDAAISVYRRFLAAYDDEVVLAALEAKHDRTYPERVEYGDYAHREIRNTELSRFDLTAAATADATAAAWARLGDKERRAHVLSALALKSAAADRAGVDALLALLRKLSPSPREIAEAEFLRTRRDADGLAAYHRANLTSAAAAPFVFQAAWELSRLAQAGTDVALYRRWLSNAKTAKDAWERHLGPEDESAHTAAAPLFTMLEQELHPPRVDGTTSLASVFGAPTLGGNGPRPLAP